MPLVPLCDRFDAVSGTDLLLTTAVRQPTPDDVGDILEAGVLDVGSPSDFYDALRSEALSQGVTIFEWASAAGAHGLDP